jgi:hypothetical protein
VSRRSTPPAAAAVTLHAAAASPPRHAPATVSLDSVADVDALVRQARALFAPIGVRQVAVTAHGVEPSIAGGEAAAINALLRHCGCVAGSVGGTLGLAGALVALWFGVGAPAVWHPRHLVESVAFALAVSLAAKGWSHVRARQRLIARLLAVRAALVASAAITRPGAAEV